MSKAKIIIMMILSFIFIAGFGIFYFLNTEPEELSGAIDASKMTGNTRNFMDKDDHSRGTWLELNCSEVLSSIGHIDKQEAIKEGTNWTNNGKTTDWKTATEYCESREMRLPTREEMACIDRNQNTIISQIGGDLFDSAWYWTKTECTNTETVENTTTKIGIISNNYPKTCVDNYSHSPLKTVIYDNNSVQIFNNKSKTFTVNYKDGTGFLRCVKDISSTCGVVSENSTWIIGENQKCESVCNFGFYKEGEVCVPDTKTCKIENGEGLQIWENNSWGECKPKTCNAGYKMDGNKCIENIKTIDTEKMVLDITALKNADNVSEGTWLELDCSELLKNVDYIEKDDYDGYLDWNSATNYCKSGGMRLATREEILCMQTNRVIENISDSSYWTKTDCGNVSGTTSTLGITQSPYASKCINATFSDFRDIYTDSNLAQSISFGWSSPFILDVSEKKDYILNTRCIKELDVSKCGVVSENSTWTLGEDGKCEYVCNFGFYKKGGICVPNTKTCEIENGNGFQIWENNSWGECKPKTCNAGYKIDGNKCVLSIGIIHPRKMNEDVESDWINLDCSEVLKNVNYIERDNTLGYTDWNTATNYCDSGGMRLPTREEAMCMRTNRSTVIEQVWGNYRIDSILHPYWTKTECTPGEVEKTISTNGVSGLTSYPSYCVETLYNYDDDDFDYDKFGTDANSAQVVSSFLDWYDKSESFDVRCIKDANISRCGNALKNGAWTVGEDGKCESVCNFGFYKEGEVCVPYTKTCEIENGNGFQIWENNSWGECKVTICNGGYIQKGNSCVFNNIETPLGAGIVLPSKMIIDIKGLVDKNDKSKGNWIELDCSKVLSSIRYVDKVDGNGEGDGGLKNETNWDTATRYCESRKMRLPTREEAMCMQKNKNTIINQIGGVNFTPDYYWTKTKCENLEMSKIGVTRPDFDYTNISFFSPVKTSCVSNYDYKISTSSWEEHAQVINFSNLGGIDDYDSSVFKWYVRCVK